MHCFRIRDGLCRVPSWMFVTGRMLSAGRGCANVAAMTGGVFITLEGGEGTGKTTQLGRLDERLRARGRNVTTTREPGGTPSAEAMRDILVRGEADALSATAEALLNYAARDDHLRRVIRPALERGEVVLCDRFMDSTRAYQAYAGDCPVRLVDVLEREIVGDTWPDLTLIFDLPVAEGLRRAGKRNSVRQEAAEDRFERKGEAFHRRLRDAYLRIARENPERCVIVDASGDMDVVERNILEILRSRGLA